MDAKNLQAFIDEDLRHAIKKVEYRNKLSEARKSHFTNQLQTAKEKPALGGLGVIFQLQSEEKIGYLEY